jgi:predicted MPP superfamily phosphohydrolase
MSSFLIGKKEPRACESPEVNRTSHPRALKRRSPRPLRPLHWMWRRTIDEIEVMRAALPVRRLPRRLAGLVACQISDFHIDREEDLNRLEQAVSIINREHPDLVFLTGDYFSRPDTMRRYIRHFGHVLAELKSAGRIFAIAGNHDHSSSFWIIRQALRESGVRVLANENHSLDLRGERLFIVGIDDLSSRHAAPARAFRGVGPNDCTIVLAHNPDTAPYTSHLGPGVMLSGHTHGGVVRIPFYGSPIRAFLRIGKKFYAGLNRYGDFYIYTNRGLGTSPLRIRINCRPEVSRFKLMLLTE